jgi:Brp/Blh family beta-carotene 15,15'-monooxygenase
MLASRQNILFGIITLLIVILHIFGLALPVGFDAWVLIVSLAITGIPHGAIDHVIFLQNQKANIQKANILKSFFTPYLLMIGTTFALWLVVPQLMFWFFLIIAAYHFGQSQLYYIKLPEKSKGKTILYLSWGIFILASLWIYHWEHQSNIIRSVFDWNLSPSGPIYFVVLSSLILSGLLNAGIFVYLFSKKILSGNMLVQVLFVLILLSALFYFTSPFLAFAIYFGLWHATRVILTEYHFLKDENGKRLKIINFVKSFLPFSLLSFIGLGLLFWFSQMVKASISPFMVFLVFISALTMPHAFFMETMYQFLGKSGKDSKPQSSQFHMS